MSRTTTPGRNSGNVIIALGSVIIIAAVLILIEMYLTNAAVTSQEGSGFVGAMTGMYEAMSQWLDALLQTMIVTALALLIAGATFIYAGVAIKNTEARLAHHEVTDTEPVEMQSFSSTVKGIFAPSADESRLLNKDWHYAAIGALFGFIFALFIGTTTFGVLFWTAVFAGGLWTTRTPSGKEFIYNMRDNINE